MANLQNIFQGGFDAANVAPDEGRDFSPLPTGAYEVEITGSEVKDTKSGTGCYLALELTVIGPTGTSRKVWQNITLKNASSDAEGIGQAQLSALCRAVGIGVLKDSDQLFGKVVRVRLGLEKGKDGHQDRNKVTAWEAINGAAQPGPAAARPAANQAPAAGAPAKKAPWAK
jgi:hypothetical protein